MKKKIKMILIVFGVIVFVWYGYVGTVKYINWKWWQGMKNEAANFEKEIADKKAKIAADTYGGKTPQETLDMFITAVEKGDYELASKYFVVERQDKELEDLRESEKKDIENVIELLKQVNKRFLKGELSNSIDNNYIVTDPILVTFIKYPSNLWKIDEI